MAKTTKKFISVLSAIILALVSLTGLISASAQDVVAIDAAHSRIKASGMLCLKILTLIQAAL